MYTRRSPVSLMLNRAPVVLININSLMKKAQPLILDIKTPLMEISHYLTKTLSIIKSVTRAGIDNLNST